MCCCDEHRCDETEYGPPPEITLKMVNFASDILERIAGIEPDDNLYVVDDVE
jgi:hypothetical protein